MLYALVSVLYWLCLYAPLPSAIQPVLTVIDFAPRWLVFIPLLMWLLFAFKHKHSSFKSWGLAAVLTISNALLVLDVKLPSLPYSATSLHVFTMGTFNAGGSRADIPSMIMWYQQQQLDVLLLQEARESEILAQLPADLQLDCYGQLCVLTQHQLNEIRQLSRKPLNGYGTYAAHYELSIDGRVFPLVNLHLNTPRYGLQMLKAPRSNYRRFLRFHADMDMESMIASQLVGDEQNRALIGGDFNLTQQSQIYRRYWRGWQNSFHQAGTGLGYTRTHKWLGARIDHILLGDDLQVLSSEVHPSMGSDHNPVIVRFALQ